MTDFGRRAGIGDMLKSVYDPILAAMAVQIGQHHGAHQSGGDDEITVAGLLGELAAAQPSTWAKVTGKPLTFAPSAHHQSHEIANGDPINVTGLVGSTPRAILGDATAGRALREFLIGISNGTNDFTLKCNTFNRFNHTYISTVDNIAKNATTSGFTLDAAGTVLTIEASILEGNVLAALASIYSTACGAALDPGVRPVSNDIAIVLSLESDGVAQDITDLVDAGDIYLTILYITDA